LILPRLSNCIPTLSSPGLPYSPVSDGVKQGSACRCFRSPVSPQQLHPPEDECLRLAAQPKVTPTERRCTERFDNLTVGKIQQAFALFGQNDTYAKRASIQAYSVPMTRRLRLSCFWQTCKLQDLVAVHDLLRFEGNIRWSSWGRSCRDHDIIRCYHILVMKFV